MRRRGRAGQSTLEYAVVIAVIVGALLAMQVYIKRGVQGRFKQASDDIGEQFSAGAGYSNYETVSTISSTEKTSPGAAVAEGAVGTRGGSTTSTTHQTQDRKGYEKVGTLDSTNEYGL